MRVVQHVHASASYDILWGVPGRRGTLPGGLPRQTPRRPRSFRFIGAAQLPQLSNAPDSPIGRTERCVKDLGFIARTPSPDPGGRRTTPGMHEPYWYPLYEKCQEWGLPIIVHGSNALDRRFRVVPHNYQLGFYTEQYLATQFIGHGDVFERFPELRIIICHCGGGLDRFTKPTPTCPRRTCRKTCSSIPAPTTRSSSRRRSSSGRSSAWCSAPRRRAPDDT